MNYLFIGGNWGFWGGFCGGLVGERSPFCISVPGLGRGGTGFIGLSSAI